MNPTGKKLLSLFLVFSIMMLSVNIYAKERRGAIIEIWGKGRFIKGELITVKQDSLLLLNTEGKDESIDIVDIKVIEMKKSKVGTGALIGFISVSGTILALNLMLIPVLDDFYFGDVIKVTAIYGGIGALIGGTIGAFMKGSKTFQLERMAESEIQETLDYLRKKARIRDYR
jgi:hypothetical protein